VKEAVLKKIRFICDLLTLIARIIAKFWMEAAHFRDTLATVGTAIWMTISQKLMTVSFFLWNILTT
jgi:hypothetical protein